MKIERPQLIREGDHLLGGQVGLDAHQATARHAIEDLAEPWTLIERKAAVQVDLIVAGLGGHGV